MKLTQSIIAVLAASLLSARADVLQTGKKIVVTGIIFQGPSDGEPARKMPLTIRNVFAVYGSVEDPKDYRYYFNLTANTYIIGLKGTADGGQGTAFANILRFRGTGGVSWNPKPNKIVGGNPCFLLEAQPISDHLEGTSLDFASTGANNTTVRWNFYGWGVIAGRQTVISGSILHVGYPLDTSAATTTR
jgi:hypothetical protein